MVRVQYVDTFVRAYNLCLTLKLTRFRLSLWWLFITFIDIMEHKDIITLSGDFTLNTWGRELSDSAVRHFIWECYMLQFIEGSRVSVLSSPASFFRVCYCFACTVINPAPLVWTLINYSLFFIEVSLSFYKNLLLIIRYFSYEFFQTQNAECFVFRITL